MPLWQSVRNGRLALYHRPIHRAIGLLPAAGCTRVVTLLSEREGARVIGCLCEHAVLQWTWLPLASERPPRGEAMAAVRQVLAALSAALDRIAFGDGMVESTLTE